MKILRAVGLVEPRLLRQARIDAESVLVQSLVKAIEDDRGWRVAVPDAEGYRHEAARARTLADSLETLGRAFPDLSSQTEALAAKLRLDSEQCIERANEEDPPESEDESYDPRRDSASSFDVDGLFADI